MKTLATSAEQLYESSLRLDARYHASDGMKVLRFLHRWGGEPAQLPLPELSVLRERSRTAYGGRRLDTLKEVCKPGGIFVGDWLKRIYVDDSEHGAPYLTGSSIVQADPTAGAKYLSYRHGDYIDQLALHEGMILMTCSGTIGNVVYVDARFKAAVGSPDLFRIVVNSEHILPGYLYAFLGSKFGYALITKGTYGGVVEHIEIPYMEGLPIPRLELATEQGIHELIERAASLRVEAQKKLDRLVRQINGEVLGIPKGYETRLPYEWSYDVKAVHRNGNLRLDPFHYAGHAVEYRQFLKPGPRLDDIATVQLPGRFKRMYVGPQGVPYLSGVDIYQLKVEPRLWLSHRQPELPELLVSTVGTILVQADGQRYGLLGRPAYADESIVGAAVSNHLVRIRAFDPDIGGYIYLFLSTEAGRRELIRHSYGTSIPTIPVQAFEDLCISQADTDLAKKMGRQAVVALRERTQANRVEDEAQMILAEALKLTRVTTIARESGWI